MSGAADLRVRGNDLEGWEMKLIISVVILALSMSAAQAADELLDGGALRYARALSRSCNADHVDFEAVINVSMTLVHRAQQNADLRFDEGLYHESREIRQTGFKFAGELASRLFLVADQALKSGCLTVADRYYHRVIDIFTGTAYASYRQRAQIGIDDVRSRRSSRAR
jgi:hypothetical protein